MIALNSQVYLPVVTFSQLGFVHVTGINNGIGTAVCPMYLAEISPKAIRGAVGTVFQMTVVSGILIAQILGFESIMGGPKLWPHLFNLAIFFGLLQCVLLPFCPESPRYLLIEQNKPKESKNALIELRGEGVHVDEEVNEIIADDQKDKAQPPVSYKDFNRVGFALVYIFS